MDDKMNDVIDMVCERLAGNKRILLTVVLVYSFQHITNWYTL